MSSPPPKKTWAELAAAAADKPPSKPAGKSFAPPDKAGAGQAKTQPKPADKPLPAASSKPVQPCFSSLDERGYPLGFENRDQFETCMEELCQTAQKQGIACKTVGVRGSAATYTSSNPNKKGQHFDSRGKGKSDIDAFIVSDSRLECRPNKTGFFHPDKVADAYPKLAEWGEAWSEELGREITPAVHKSTSPALDEPYIAYACDC
ncbi:hypothetical protein LZ009_16730 [Ramlibacter sp. XY19]|uniref:hypothetical protein n=1 Tax=Ramlibacter paludis TaxID=2908000 RepID=UPI0023DB500F|nr:hypothetical protein [Ramlibacter paludis]MCG2594424.1 hypothetical protein [Ramlibacter paludis]